MKKIYTHGLPNLIVTLVKKQTTKKIGFVAGLLLTLAITAFSQTNYYLRTDSFNVKGAQVRPDITNIKAWSTDGTKAGALPTNFTTDGQIFNIQTNGFSIAGYSINKTWTVSGMGSKVVIGSDTAKVTFILQGNAIDTATFNVLANATLILQLANTSTIKWGNLATGSTVRFGGNTKVSQQVIPANYYNLSLAVSGGNYYPLTFPQATIGVAGVFNSRISNMYGSTIEFNGTGGQAITGSFYNLSITGNKTVPDSLKGTITVAGSFTNSSSGAGLLSFVKGTTLLSGTVTYLGLAPQTILSNQAYFNMAFSNGFVVPVSSFNYNSATITLYQANPDIAVGQKISLNALNIKSNPLTLDTTATITAITADTILTLSKPVKLRLYVNPVGHAPGSNVDTVYATTYSAIDSTVTLDSSWSFNAGDTIKGQIYNNNGFIASVNGNVIKTKGGLANTFNLGNVAIGAGNDQPSAKTVTGLVSIISGFNPSIGTINTTGSTFDYIGKKQGISGGKNFSYDNLVINQDSATTASLSAATLVTGNFTLQSGKLTTTANNLLTLDVNATFPTVTNDTFFISGPLAKNFLSTSPFTYQIGLVVAGLAKSRTVTITPKTADAKTYKVSFAAGKTTNSTNIDRTTINSIDSLSNYNVGLSGYSAGADTSAQLSFNFVPTTGYTDSNLVLAHYFHGFYTAESAPMKFIGVTPISFTTISFDTTFGRYVFATAGPVIVPVKLSAVTATALVNKTIKINWSSANELSVGKYIVEGSVDGIKFSTKGTLSAKGSSDYSFVDATPSAGINYYRIKVLDIDGKVSYSTIVSAKQTLAATISIANPVKNKQLSFVLSSGVANYTLKVTNVLGQSIASKTIAHNGGASTYSVSLPSSALAGTYFVQLTSSNNQSTKTIVVE